MKRYYKQIFYKILQKVKRRKISVVLIIVTVKLFICGLYFVLLLYLVHFEISQRNYIQKSKSSGRKIILTKVVAKERKRKIY